MIVGIKAGNGIRTASRLLGLSAPVIIHFGSAFGAEYKTGQHIGFSGCVCAMDNFSRFLRQSPGFGIDNRLSRVLKDKPFLWRPRDKSLVLIGLLIGLEVDSMPHIFGAFQNAFYCADAPIIWPRHICTVLVNPYASFCLINRRAFNLFIPKDFCNGYRPFPVHGKLKNIPHDLSGVLVNDPMILIRGVFLIAVDGVVAGRLPGFALELWNALSADSAE